MLLESAQLVSIFVNLGVILLGVVLTFLILWRLKIGNKNNVLIFLLFIVYWIGPLMTRDYTGLIQLSFGLDDHGLLLIWPLLAYGIIGLAWRPLSDVFAFKFTSRKKVLYLSLLIEIACMVPMIAKPTLVTNIIQSVGAGIGASCIGLFNLMFNEADARRNTLTVVSILAIPPILAQFFASGFMSLITTFESSFDSKEEFVGVLWWMWIVALFFALVAIVMVFFVKEREETLYKNNEIKEPVTKKTNIIGLILICFIAMCTTLIRWATAGPTASVQIAYLGQIQATDTRFYEGYGSLIHTIGQLFGVVAVTLVMKKTNRNGSIPIMIIATICSLVYLSAVSLWPNIPVFMSMNALNGLSYGLIYPMVIGVVINKFFPKTEKISPTGLYNMCLSLGICVGNIIHCVLKSQIFDQLRRFSIYGFEEFKAANTEVNIICGVFAILMMIAYISYYIIRVKFPPEKSERKQHWARIGDTEL